MNKNFIDIEDKRLKQYLFDNGYLLDLTNGGIADINLLKHLLPLVLDDGRTVWNHTLEEFIEYEKTHTFETPQSLNGTDDYSSVIAPMTKAMELISKMGTSKGA